MKCEDQSALQFVNQIKISCVCSIYASYLRGKNTSCDHKTICYYHDTKKCLSVN